MEFRQIGRSDLRIAPLMLGCNVFGWTADQPTSFAILDAFVDAGFNAIDTADVYSRWSQGGVGISEEIIGNWITQGGKRDKIMLATKFGGPMSETDIGLSAAYMERAVEASLKRLKTDVIDLYFSHRDDPNTPQEETMEAFERLMKAGKVRALGCSNFTPERMRSANAISKANGWARYECIQPLYNLAERHEMEGELAKVCLEDQIGVVTFFGLARGFLTGKYRTEADLAQSPRGARGVGENYMNPRGMKILEALDNVSARNGATLAQISLAWQIAKPYVTAPIASATNLTQLADLLVAARVKLTEADMAELDAAGA